MDGGDAGGAAPGGGEEKGNRSEAHPSSETWPTLNCTDAWSPAPIRRLVALHFLGMYRSTISPASFCIAAALLSAEPNH